jgi:hypothetical protein
MPLWILDSGTGSIPFILRMKGRLLLKEEGHDRNTEISRYMLLDTLDDMLSPVDCQSSRRLDEGRAHGNASIPAIPAIHHHRPPGRIGRHPSPLKEAG